MSRDDRENKGRIAGSIHERAEFALEAIRQQNAVVKTIKTISDDRRRPDPLKKHWDFWLDQLNSPATVRPTYPVDLNDRVHVWDPRDGTSELKLSRKGRRRPARKSELHRHAKKTPVTLLPSNGRMKLYDSAHTVGILFYVPWCDHKDEKYIFSGNIGSNGKPWLGQRVDIGALKDAHRFLDELREHNERVKDDEIPPRHTELDWGVSKESMFAVFATRNTYAAALNAVHKAIYIEQKTGVRLPVLLHDPNEVPYHEPSEITPEIQAGAVQWAFERRDNERLHCQGFVKDIARLLNIHPHDVAAYLLNRGNTETLSDASSDEAFYNVALQLGVDDLPHDVHEGDRLMALVDMAVVRKNHVLLYQLLSKYPDRISLDGLLLENQEYPELVIQLILFAIEDRNENLLFDIIRVRPEMLEHEFMNHHKFFDLVLMSFGGDEDPDEANATGMLSEIVWKLIRVHPERLSNENKNRFLSYAVREGRQEAITLLIENGATKLLEIKGEDPVSSAVDAGRWDILDLLLKQLPTLNMQSAIPQALREGRHDLAHTIIKNGALNSKKIIDAIVAVEGGLQFLLEHQRFIHPESLQVLLSCIDDSVDPDMSLRRSLLVSGVGSQWGNVSQLIKEAAQAGQWEYVDLLAEHVSCAIGRMIDLGDALLEAAKHKREKTALLLLKNYRHISKYNFDSTDSKSKGYTAVHFAVLHDMPQLLEALLQAPHRGEPNQIHRDLEAITPTELAFNENKKEALLILMRYGGKVSDGQYVEKTKEEGGWEFIKTIADAGHLSNSGKERLFPLAVADGQIDLIDALQPRYEPQAYSVVTVKHPIVAAAKAKQWDMVEKLSTFPCYDANADDYGEALLEAVSEGQEKVALSLVQNSPYIDLGWYYKSGSNEGFGVAHFAVKYDMRDLLEAVLLRHPQPLNPNFRFKSTNTATEFSFQNANRECLLLLLQQGGTLPDQFYECASFEKLERIEPFIPNAVADKLLLRVVRDGLSDEWVNHLLRRHADLTAKNIDGDTAIVVAAKKGHWGIVDRLSHIPTDEADKAGYAEALKLAYHAGQQSIVLNIINRSIFLDRQALGLSDIAESDSTFVRQLIRKNEMEILTALITLPGCVQPMMRQAFYMGHSVLVSECLRHGARIENDSVLSAAKNHQWEFLATLRDSDFLSSLPLSDLLVHAAHDKQGEWVAWLLKSGARNNAVLDGKTAIEHAAEQQDWETVSMFLAHPTNTNDDGHYVNALLKVIEAGQSDLAEDMLERALGEVSKEGVFLKIAQAGHWTFLESQKENIPATIYDELLLCAFKAGQESFVVWLLESASELSLKQDDQGKTILQLAAESRKTTLLQAIVEKFPANDYAEKYQYKLAMDILISAKDYAGLSVLLAKGSGFMDPEKSIAQLADEKQWALLQDLKDSIAVDKDSIKALLKYAIRDNRADLVEELLPKVSLDDLERMTVGVRCQNPIKYALLEEHYGVLEALLKTGVPCCFEDFEIIVSKEWWDLLDAGLEHFNEPNQLSLLLISAVKNEKVDLVNRILDKDDFDLNDVEISVSRENNFSLPELVLRSEDVRIVDAFMQKGLMINYKVGLKLLDADKLQSDILKTVFGYFKKLQVKPKDLNICFDEGSKELIAAELRVAFYLIKQSGHIATTPSLQHIRDLARDAFYHEVYRKLEAEQRDWVEWALQQPIFNEHCSPISMGKPKYQSRLEQWLDRLPAVADSASSSVSMDGRASERVESVNPEGVTVENLRQLHSVLTGKLQAHKSAASSSRLLSNPKASVGNAEVILRLEALVEKVMGVIDLHAVSYAAGAESKYGAQARQEIFAHVGKEILNMQVQINEKSITVSPTAKAIFDDMVDAFNLKQIPGVQVDAAGAHSSQDSSPEEAINAP